MHSTVYNVEGVEASINLFKLHDPDHNTSWFELGERAGIEIVDEEEVDTEVQEVEEDKEVEHIYNDAKDKHRQIMTGTCIFSVLSKVSEVLCTEYYVFNHADIRGIKIRLFIVFLLNIGGVEGTLYRM